MPSGFLDSLGGAAGCLRLARAFYSRVGRDPVLKPLFPGKSLRCATEEFAAFLVQFLDGDEEETQHRWWLSLRESHARFRIGPAERSAWLTLMRATLDEAPLDEGTRTALRSFFLHSSAYLIGKDAAEPAHAELATRWGAQRALDDVVAALVAGEDEKVLAAAPALAARGSVFVGLAARMMQTGRTRLVRFVVEALERDPSLAERRFGGKSLLHFAAGAGCVAVVEALLRLGTDPDELDRGGHTALYCVANECGGEAGPAVVRMLVRAGADVRACGGVTRATALHMAARRGFVEMAWTLIECGADVRARDYKGVTALGRARNLRRTEVAALIVERGGVV
ncbi:ankyrin repeat domain-containing protein [uncultured Paludibaculum sp.]|uniref:ankyrin repeat domain-containing protein n=1 Tax=uncultured Paludibaculum sp. TaxID=1765020 RepID=UPI002AAAB5A2|nr:ankyrin repeat domain-containing protein [uncultured Paludibaculum sp.]